MKLAIIGSRGFNDYQTLKQICEMVSKKYNITHIVSGGAKGADTLGEQFAKEYDIETIIFLPDWETYGKSAGYKRNVDIVSNSDIVIAFWDGESKGTVHSMNISKKLNKKLIVYNYKKNIFIK